MPIGEDVGGAELSMHATHMSSDSAHAHQSFDAHEQQKDSHSGTVDDCFACECCVMGYQETLGKGDADTAATSPFAPILSDVTSTREPFVADRPPQFS